jgi:hypothetical protein
MEEYWKARPQATPPVHPVPDAGGDDDLGSSASVVTSFDRYRQTLVSRDEDEGWASEKRRYLKDMPADVTKETNVIEWWQVSKLRPVFATHFTFLLTGARSIIPYPGTNCPGCTSLPSVFRSMRALILF